MHKNIFLASYPKSGNTWLRSIIGNFYNFDKDFSLNNLKLIPLLSIKKHFTEFENKVYINNNDLHFIKILFIFSCYFLPELLQRVPV